MMTLLRGGTVVAALDPPEVARPTSSSRTAGSRPAAPAARSLAGTEASTARLPDRAGQRVRPHPPLLGARARHALPPRAAARLRRDPAPGLVAARPRARRGVDPGLGLVGRDGGAARRDDHARSTIMPRPGRSTGRSTSSPRRSPSSASARCCATRRPTATDPAVPGPASPRTAASSAAWPATQRPLARGMVGAHASFTLSDETLAGCADLARRAVAGSTSTSPRTPPTSGTPRSARQRVVERLERAGALDPTPAGPRGPPRRAEVALVRAAGATVVHNPRSNMNNAVGRAPLAALGARVALGTDGIGADMFEESRVGYLRHREERSATTGEDHDATISDLARRMRPGRWRAGRGPRVAGEAFGEPSSGWSSPARRRTWSSSTTRAPTPLTARPGRPLGLRAVGAGRSATSSSPADGRPRPPPGPVDAEAIAAEAREAAGRLWGRLDEIDDHPFEPGECDGGELSDRGRRWLSWRPPVWRPVVDLTVEFAGSASPTRSCPPPGRRSATARPLVRAPRAARAAWCPRRSRGPPRRHRSRTWPRSRTASSTPSSGRSCRPSSGSSGSTRSPASPDCRSSSASATAPRTSPSSRRACGRSRTRSSCPPTTSARTPGR